MLGQSFVYCEYSRDLFIFCESKTVLCHLKTCDSYACVFIKSRNTDVVDLFINKIRRKNRTTACIAKSLALIDRLYYNYE